MTAIVGIARDGTVYVGGDSRITYNDVAVADSERKVWRHQSGILIGAAGDGRLCSDIRHRLGELPPIKRPIRTYLATTFVDALLDIVGTEPPDGYELGILIGISGHLYMLDSRLSVVDVGKFHAIGAGGALSVLDDLHRHDPKCDPVDTCYRAMKAASRQSVTVGPPFHLFSSDHKRPWRWAR